jgi:DNA-binding NtrC family response regulator
VKTASGWAALYASEAEARPTFAVERLQAQPSAAQRKTVAVLDSDRAVTDAICAHLQDSGYDARPFHRLGDVAATGTSGNYDAVILDWLVGDEPTLPFIASIRAHDATCPVILLTDEVQKGRVRESEIAEAVRRFNLVFSEKPVRLTILSASLARAFSLR